MIEYPAPEVSTIGKQAPEGGIYTKTAVVVKFSKKLEVMGYKIDALLCVGLYNEEYRSIANFSRTDPYSDIN